MQTVWEIVIEIGPDTDQQQSADAVISRYEQERNPGLGLSDGVQHQLAKVIQVEKARRRLIERGIPFD